MKTRSCVVACVLALVVLFAGARVVQASTLFSDDFTGLNSGQDLNGQDGWSAINNWSSLTVTGTAAINSYGGNCGGSKPLSLPAFSSSDTVVATARFYDNGNGGDIVAGLVDGNQSGTNWLPGFGISGTHSYVRDILTFAEHSGSTTFAGGNYYDLRLTVNLSTAGGLGTYSWKTLDETSFATDSGLVNVPLGLHTDAQGKYDFNAFALRISDQGTWITHFDISTPTAAPEPSALALVVTGLIGLLAYAWRKRK
jgi:hypothetical protein